MKSEEFEQRYKAIVERALAMNDKARREGLLSLEDCINHEKYLQRDVFELGIRVAVDGTDASRIERLLSNIINLEEDKDERTLKTIQKEAVLSIQEGINRRFMLLLMNSYVSIGIEETMKGFIDDWEKEA